MFKKRRLWLGAGLILLVLLGLYFFTGGQSVNVVTPIRGMAVDAVYATGTVEPVNHSEVASKITGRLTEVRAKEGDKVNPGDVLAEIDEQEDASNVAQLRAQLILSESDLARQRSLRQMGHISQSALDKSVSERNSTKALLDAAQARLDEHFIKAPMAGEVMRAPDQMKPGDIASVGQVLFIVGDPSVLRIDAEVDEEDVPRVKVGQEALLRADAFANQDLKGVVSEMTPFGDPVKRTYRVYIGLPAGTPLLSGMTAEINIIVARHENAMLVPVTSLAGNRVWIADGRRARMQEVQIGSIGKDKAEIISGLTMETKVIVDPTGLKDGQSVRTHETEQTP